MGFGLAPAMTDCKGMYDQYNTSRNVCENVQICFPGRGGIGSKGREKHCYSKKRISHGINRCPQCRRGHHRVREEVS